MSTYNLMYGMNPMSFFVIPALFGKHPNDLPRFRDSFVWEREGSLVISILSRTGSPIRKDYDVRDYTENPNFIGVKEVLEMKDFSDDTYAFYNFSVPDDFKEDISLLNEGNIPAISNDLKGLIKNIFPKLKRELDVLFKID